MHCFVCVQSKMLHFAQLGYKDSQSWEDTALKLETLSPDLNVRKMRQKMATLVGRDVSELPKGNNLNWSQEKNCCFASSETRQSTADTATVC